MDGISIQKSRFYFKNKSLASLYAILFLNAGRLLWLDPNSHGSFFLLAKALKRGIDIGKLTENDFFKTDREVFKMLRKVNDDVLEKYLDRLTPKTKFVYSEEEPAEFFGPNKPRVVDPLVKISGKLVHISSLIPRLKEMFDHYKKTYKILGVSEG